MTHAGHALVVEGLRVTYGSRLALHDVSFAVGWGEVVAVVGPNGAGKSSMFKAITGLVEADGTVALGGTQCHHHRDRMGASYLPQASSIDLDFPVTVQQMVASGRRRFLRMGRRLRGVDHAIVDGALDRVGLADRAASPIGTLSGGQRQRVFLARALAQEADVLLLDEALSGVDAPSTDDLLGLFHDLANDGRTILVATHDLALARRRFDRCLAINGTLVADGLPADVLNGDILDAVFGTAVPPSLRANV